MCLKNESFTGTVRFGTVWYCLVLVTTTIRENHCMIILFGTFEKISYFTLMLHQKLNSKYKTYKDKKILKDTNLFLNKIQTTI